MTCSRFPRFALLLCALLPALTNAADYPGWLPPEQQVRHTLESLPQLRASRTGVRVEQANAGRLQAGSQEWSVRAGLQQRSERIGRNDIENDIALERPIRFANKARKDFAIGENGISVADAALADNWHETARTLMTLWFNWLREERNAQRLNDYAQVLSREVQLVSQRVKAGDAPKRERLLAETELAKAHASEATAMQRAQLLANEISTRFPGIVAALPTPLPAPQPLQGEVAAWQQKILTNNHELELAERTARQEKLIAERVVLERQPDPVVGVRLAQERGGQERILGLSLSMPLAGQYRNKLAEAAIARAQMAEEHAEETRVRVENRARQVALLAASAPALWQRLRDVAQQTQDDAALASRAYALGEAPVSDTLLARRHAIEAQAVAEQAQIDALESWSLLLLDTHAIWGRHDGHEHR